MTDEQRNRKGRAPNLVVGISNPETTAGLMDLAQCIASEQGFRVIATHILKVPIQANLGSARGSKEMAEARERLLGAIREARARGVSVKGVVEVARDVDEGLVSAAENQDASLLMVGYSEAPDEGDGDERAFDRVMHSVARDTRVDLVIAKLRRSQMRSVLLPINTGLNLAVSGMLAQAISRARDARVTLIHLLREDEESEEEARRRLEANLTEEGFEDLGELVVERPREGMDPIDQMLETANRHDITIVGAEPRPSIAESIFGSWAEEIASRAECTVLVVRAKSVLEEG